MSNPKSEVAKWYVGRTIFVTGGSGFMGKVLLEKLLRGCPGLNKIYVLLRTKRNQTPQQRLNNIIKLPLFESINKKNPHLLKKLVAVSGEITIENFALSEEDRREILAEVSVVFHCAATLKLDSNLKDAIDMNTGGTQYTVDFCKQMPKLEAFIHLSTAFCYCDIERLGEKVYDVPNKPSDVIDCSKWMNLDALNKATPRLIEPHPNTYLYTKRLAEGIIADQFPQMPVAIARPSIVTPSWEEPVEGWVDNLNGPVGLLVGAGKGVIRSMYCNAHYHAHVVPVDIAINGLITIAWKTGTQKSQNELPVYNMTQHAAKPLTWAEIINKGRNMLHKYPFEGCVWFPDGDIRSSRLAHNLCVIFLHLLPAYIIDFLLFIFLQKTFMVRVQKKISDGSRLLQFFTTREWIFECDNFMRLWDNLNKTDKKLFPMDFGVIDDDVYLKRMILGARQYIMKENLSSLPRCRTQQKFLYVLDRITALTFYFFVGWLIIVCFETVFSSFTTVISYIKL